MSQTRFTTEETVTDEWLTYIVNEATALSRQGDFEIENYADREILNPDVIAELNQIPDEDDSTLETLRTIGASSMSLSFAEASQIRLFGGLNRKFRRAKEKIRSVLCRILSELENEGVLDWKVIVSAVLVALAGTFFGVGLGAVLLPILVALIAKIIKIGLDSVCPV